MARILFAILLLFATLHANAWQCIPKQWGGTGTYLSVASNADGWVWAWSCHYPDGSDHKHHLTLLKSYAPPTSGCTPSAAAAAVAAASDVAATANALFTQCSAAPADQAASQALDYLTWMGETAVYTAYIADHPPNGPIWRTPLTGTFTMYLTSNGKLSSVAPTKATPAALCDCTKAITSGTSTYCPLAATVSPVTLCKQVSQ